MDMHMRERERVRVRVHVRVRVRMRVRRARGCARGCARRLCAWAGWGPRGGKSRTEHPVERLLEGVLLGGGLARLLDDGQVVAHLLLDERVQRGHLVGLDRAARLVLDLAPVPLAHARVEHRVDQRQVRLELLQLELHVGHHLVRLGLGVAGRWLVARVGLSVSG